jgi:hypothetical protein
MFLPQLDISADLVLERADEKAVPALKTAEANFNPNTENDIQPPKIIVFDKT